MCARPANPELKSEIIKAATEIVEACGPDCVTMREVAEKVGYSATTLYLYFKDKEAILAAVMAQGFDDLADFRKMAEVGPTAIDRLRQRSRAYIVWGIMHPDLYHLMLSPTVDITCMEEHKASLEHNGVDTLAVVADAISGGELVGIDDEVAFTRAIWAGLHGPTSLANDGHFSDPCEETSAKVLVEETTAVADGILDALLEAHMPEGAHIVRKSPARKRPIVTTKVKAPAKRA